MLVATLTIVRNFCRLRNGGLDALMERRVARAWVMDYWWTAELSATCNFRSLSRGTLAQAATQRSATGTNALADKGRREPYREGVVPRRGIYRVLGEHQAERDARDEILLEFRQLPHSRSADRVA